MCLLETILYTAFMISVLVQSLYLLTVYYDEWPSLGLLCNLPWDFNTKRKACNKSSK